MADARALTIEVEIVYALPHAEFAQTLRVPAGADIAQAIAQSGLLERHPEIEAASAALGIFGKRAEPTTVLHDFDRIEIYRPLRADPMQARRARARGAGKPARR